MFAHFYYIDIIYEHSFGKKKKIKVITLFINCIILSQRERERVY